MISITRVTTSSTRTNATYLSTTSKRRIHQTASSILCKSTSTNSTNYLIRNHIGQQQQFQSTAATSTDTQHNNSEDDSSTSYSLFGWGTSEVGTLPFQKGPSKQVYDHPKQVELSKTFSDVDTPKVTSVACGPTSTGIVLSNNTCYTFGSNKYGQLGHGHTNNVDKPTLLSPAVDDSGESDDDELKFDEISQIAMGTNFSAIIDTNGDLFTCGYNGSILKDGIGSLGHSITTDQDFITKPKLVQSLVEDGCYASAVTVGDAHMTVLTTEGEVLTCGAGTYGRCGNVEPVDQYYLEPVELLSSEPNITQIAAGKAFTMALNSREGIVFCWGQNDKGQCGSGSGLAVDMYSMETMPIAVEGMLEGRKVVKIAAGHSHAAAVTEMGELYMWGMRNAFLPELATTLLHTKIVDVSCGKDYTIALDEDGKIYSSGRGKTGVLGLLSAKKSEGFSLVEGMLGYKVDKVVAGWNHVACLAVEEDGAD